MFGLVPHIKGWVKTFSIIKLLYLKNKKPVMCKCAVKGFSRINNSVIGGY
jgi:hypothetical protein